MSNVYFAPVHSGENQAAVIEKVKNLYQRAGLTSCVGDKDFVAVKMHFGELLNDTHIPPELVRPVVDSIRSSGGEPFLTDTCVLYKSQRDNAVNHLKLAHEHGFTMERAGAPVIIADGLFGNAERDVKIPGRIFKEVSLASLALEANALMVLTHVTGHLGTGMGAAIKNLGMGFASRKGKMRQHSTMKPAVLPKDCTRCGVCLEWCPVKAISMQDDAAFINRKTCIGCGECLTVCRFDAIKYNWKMKESDLQQRMAEHALGAVIGKPGKVGYMNFLISMTKDCDCFDVKQSPIIADIGILAGTDPVALDAASLHMIQKHAGSELQALAYPDADPWVQIRHAEAVGLGSATYTLMEVDV